MKVFSVIVLFVSMLLVGCGSQPQADLSQLPEGDAARGQTLFNEQIGGAPACATCHRLDGTVLVGPSLQGYSAVAATRVEGMDAQAYTHASIVRPAEYIVSGFNNVMFGQYAQRLTPAQLADLIAYLLTL